ncbi:50S ribosomal protein L24 [Thiohalophilus thiocyanatoxydans]|uniref:Large ribosomal subunit protein uL24 n=1 Tax=Thiohalophilus thiocyanatoxydans TaxID=381308 RepID=A0A4R8IFM4_9GAMM|nr:50S ribosomal protein L24 [Thiohalophilus thiocyanatoxydans]TDX97962.1 large subunit ribosomal protein L24 [Thiohalophilus thiocyanatoxydans]
MNKIRKGDEIVVIAGKDKGKRGTVSRVMMDEGNVLVDNINVVKKHQKPNPAAGAAGGIVEMEKPLDISNVAIYNPVTDKPDRVGFKTLEDGRKVRYLKSNGEVLDA